MSRPTHASTSTSGVASCSRATARPALIRASRVATANAGNPMSTPSNVGSVIAAMLPAMLISSAPRDERCDAKEHGTSDAASGRKPAVPRGRRSSRR